MITTKINLTLTSRIAFSHDSQMVFDSYANTICGDWLHDFNWLEVPIEFHNYAGEILEQCALFRDCMRNKCAAAITPDERKYVDLFPLFARELRVAWYRLKHPIRYKVARLILKWFGLPTDYYITELQDACAEQVKFAQWFYNYIK